MNEIFRDAEIQYDGDLLKAVKFKRGREERPIWKRLEHLKPNEMIFWVDRFDSLCPIASEWALAQALESAATITVSRRMNFVRSIFCEINRLVWLTSYLSGVVASLAQMSLAQQILVLREQVFSMQEELMGSRVLPGVLRIGGSRRELAMGDGQKIKQFIAGWKFSYQKWLSLVEPDGLLMKRLDGLLVISKQAVKKHGWWGVVGKASDVSYDSRKHRPHGAYPFIDFNVPLRKSGDALSRFEIACQEASLSIEIIERLLGLIPAQATGEKIYDKLEFQAGLFFGTAESAKGPVVAAVEANHDHQIVSLKLFTAGQRVWPHIEQYFGGLRAEDLELAVASLGMNPEEAEV